MTSPIQVPIDVCNDLLQRLGISFRVNSFEDIGAHVFVVLYEALVGEVLKDAVRDPRTEEDDIHNVQQVIDSLALDILRTSLSHITGEAVVRGDCSAVTNLLEVLLGILSYMLDRAEAGEEDPLDDTNRVAPEAIERALCRPGPDSPNIAREAEARHDNMATHQQAVHSKGVPGKHDSPPRSERRAVGSYSPPTRDSGSPARHGAEAVAWSAGDSTLSLLAAGHPDLDLSGPDVTLQLQEDSFVSVAQIGAVENKRRKAKVSSGRLTSGGKAASLPASKYLSSSGGAQQTAGLRRTADIEVRSAGPLSPRAVPETPQLPASQPAAVAADGGRNSSLQPLQADSSARTPLLLQQPTAEPERVSEPSEARGSSPLNMQHLNATEASVDPSNKREERPTQREEKRPVSHEHHVYHHYSADAVPVASSTSVVEAASVPAASHTDSGDRLAAPSSGAAPLTSGAAAGTSSVGGVVERGQGEPAPQSRPGAASIGAFDLPPFSSDDSLPHSQSYENLRQLLRQTVSMSRAALGQPALPEQSRAHRESRVPAEQPVPGKESGAPVDQPALTEPRKDKSHEPNTAHAPLLDPPEVIDAKLREEQRRLQSIRDEARALLEVSTSHSRLADVSRQETSTDAAHPTDSRPLSSGHSAGRHNSSGRVTSVPVMRGDGSPLRSSLRKSSARQTNVRLAKNSARPPKNSARSTKSSPSRYFSLDSSPEVTRSSLGSEFVPRYPSQIDADLSSLLSSPSKRVRFRAESDEQTPVELREARQLLREEEQVARLTRKILDKQYQLGLSEMRREKKGESAPQRRKAKVTEKQYKAQVAKKPRASTFTRTCAKKPALPPRPATTSGGASSSKSVSGTKKSPVKQGVVSTKANKTRTCKKAASPQWTDDSPVPLEADLLLPQLLQRFPSLHVSRQTLNTLWRRCQSQIQFLRSENSSASRKAGALNRQAKEAVTRQQLMLEIMRREVAHNQRMREQKERAAHESGLRRAAREQRQQSVRCRRYYENYQLRHRARMLQRRSREEQLFKRVFGEALALQKERVRELRDVVKEQRERRADKQQQEISSLENFYRDRFAMLAESMARERTELKIKEKAQGKALAELTRGLRSRLEGEVSDLQQQLCRAQDDDHFRQLDATSTLRWLAHAPPSGSAQIRV